MAEKDKSQQKSSDTTEERPQKENSEAGLEAEQEWCGGDLRVVAFAYPDTSSAGEYKEEYQRLSGIAVTIAMGQFSDCRHTQNDGQCLFNDIPPGRYTVTAALPEGYKRSLSHPSPPVDVKEAQQTVVHIGFVPKPATITGYVYCELYGQQKRIGKVPIDFYFREERLACTETDSREGRLGCFEQEVTRPGAILVVPKQTIRADGRTFHTRCPNGILVQADSGQTCHIALLYTAKRARISVSACLIRNTDDGEEQLPLAGLIFRLFRGHSVHGTPFREETANGPTAAIFSDLDEGDYTIAVVRSLDFRGQAIELFQPTEGLLPLHLAAGQTLDLSGHFCFRPCQSRVSGVVLDATCGDGIGGIPVVLYRADGESAPIEVTTDLNGVYVVEGIAPAEYVVRLAQNKALLPDGSVWVLDSTESAEKRVRTRGAATTQIPAFHIKPDVSRILGEVVDTEGKPVPFAELTIYDETGAKVLASLIAEENGTFTWVARQSGLYYVAPNLSPSGEAVKKYPAKVQSDAYLKITVPTPHRTADVGGGRQHIQGSYPHPQPRDGAISPVTDIAAYPVLTASVQSTAGGGATRGGELGSLGQIAERALRDVLAWRPKASDPKGFVAALTQAFTCEEKEGRTECSWTPRSFAVQADIGAVTGAQASIFTRAKVALDQSTPLLDGLKPLRSDADTEDTEATRAIVRAELTELVNELGAEGGPRVQRVDTLFELLLGPEPEDRSPSPDPLSAHRLELGEGQLAALQAEFGLRRARVNTIEEEQNLTNFLILVDYVQSLKKSWDEQRTFFDRRGDDVFLGTQLVLLSRALAVVAESVHEVRLTMDSVFLGEAERQTLRLDFANGTIPPPDNSGSAPYAFPSDAPPLFVAELLSWAESFAAEEGPRLVQQGGKAGVRAFFPPLDKLRKLVRASLIVSYGGVQNPVALSAGYSTDRVQRALKELTEQLDEVARLARPFTSKVSKRQSS